MLYEVERLTKMKKLNDAIQKNSAELSEEIRKADDKLDLLVRKAKATLRALNIELTDTEHDGTGAVTLPLLQLQSSEALAAADVIGGMPGNEVGHAVG